MSRCPGLSRARGLSLLEVVIALVILMAALIPMLDLFGVSGRTVAKSQNLTLAVGLAHKIAQHLMAQPYSSIVDLSERPLAGGPADGMFQPLINHGSDLSSGKGIKPDQMKDLYEFVGKFKVKYALDVVGDEPKDVKIIITWEEGGRNLLYSLRVYVANH